MPKVFISYRREGGKPYAGRLYDHLSNRLGKPQVFMDISQIAPGSDFAASINQAIDSCDALLVVIDRTWLNVPGSDGGRRLDDPDDLHRLEIATALRKNCRVIPVLVDGAVMPAARDLPDDVKHLARHQAHELSDTRWDYDVERLVEAIAATDRHPDEKPKGETTALLQPRSYLGAASMVFGVTALPFALLFAGLMSAITGEAFGAILGLALPGGLAFGLAMGLIAGAFLRGETVVLSFPSRTELMTRLSVALAELGYNPATSSGDFLTFKPSFQAGLLAGRISVAVRGGTATVVGATMHVKRLKKRFG